MTSPRSRRTKNVQQRGTHREPRAAERRRLRRYFYPGWIWPGDRVQVHVAARWRPACVVAVYSGNQFLVQMRETFDLWPNGRAICLPKREGIFWRIPERTK